MAKHINVTIIEEPAFEYVFWPVHDSIGQLLGYRALWKPF